MRTHEPITLESIREAQRVIRRFVRPTPLVELLPGSGIHLKLENVHPVVHAFKIRGAAKRLMNEPYIKIVTAAIGSHGFAMGKVSQETKHEVTCFMPASAPDEKKEKMRRMVARVIVEGKDFSEAEKAALEYADRHDQQFIHPYDDPEIIAGQGTVALEIADISHLRRVYVPVGGGGLFAGMAIALKELRPEVKIIGVRPTAAFDTAAPQLAGRLIPAENPTSLAEPLLVTPRPGSITLEYLERYMDALLCMREDQIRAAMLGIYERTGHRVEGAGAIAVAAALGDPERLDLRHKEMGTSVCIVTGGNISGSRFEQEVLRRKPED